MTKITEISKSIKKITTKEYMNILHAALFICGFVFIITYQDKYIPSSPTFLLFYIILIMISYVYYDKYAGLLFLLLYLTFVLTKSGVSGKSIYEMFIDSNAERLQQIRAALEFDTSKTQLSRDVINELYDIYINDEEKKILLENYYFVEDLQLVK